MKNNFTNEEIYILQDALITYKYGQVNRSHCPKNKNLSFEVESDLPFFISFPPLHIIRHTYQRA